jgi:hypothetical protein
MTAPMNVRTIVYRLAVTATIGAVGLLALAAPAEAQADPFGTIPDQATGGPSRVSTCT